MEMNFWSSHQNEQWRINVGLAEMLKGGVIMDVTNAAQAKIAEKAGACAVMALERVPADIRAQGGVAACAIRDYQRKFKTQLYTKREAIYPKANSRGARVIIDQSEVLPRGRALLVKSPYKYHREAVAPCG